MIPCCCISFFLTIFLVKGHSLRREDDAKLQEAGKEWAARHKGVRALNRNKKEKYLSGEAHNRSGDTAEPGANQGVVEEAREKREEGGYKP